MKRISKRISLLKTENIQLLAKELGCEITTINEALNFEEPPREIKIKVKKEEVPVHYKDAESKWQLADPKSDKERFYLRRMSKFAIKEFRERASDWKDTWNRLTDTFKIQFSVNDKDGMLITIRNIAKVYPA